VPYFVSQNGLRYLGQRTGALPTLSLRSQGVKVELNVANEEAIRHDINEALVFGAFLEYFGALLLPRLHRRLRSPLFIPFSLKNNAS
jgi:hypothetical protein